MRPQAGMSLVEVMAAVAVLGALIYAGASATKNGDRSMQAVGGRFDFEQMKQLILQRTSCDAATFPCTAGTSVDLKTATKAGVVSVLVPAAGARIGRAWVRAECGAGGKSVVVRALPLLKSSTTGAPQFAPNESGKIFTMADPESLLFPSGVPVCAQKSVDAYPDVVVCAYQPGAFDPATAAVMEFKRTLIYPDKTNWLRFDNAIVTGGFTSVFYKTTTGAATRMMWRTGWDASALQKIIGTPAGNGVYSGGTMRCPPKLRYDGRRIDSIFSPK